MTVYPDQGEEKISDRSVEGAPSGREDLYDDYHRRRARLVEGALSGREDRRDRAEDLELETPAVLAKIEAQLHRNLKTLQHLSEDIDEPQTRGAVQRLLRDLRTQQREVATLRRLMTRYPELGSLARVRQRLNYWLQSSSARSFLWGAGLSLAVLALLPLARKNLRPLVVKVMREIMELTDKSQELVAGLKEGLEDLVSEAQFEAMKQSLEPEGQKPPLPTPGPEK